MSDDAALRIASRLVAAVFDLPPELVIGPGKGPPARVHARQVICYLLHTEAEMSLIRIARALDRDRATVSNAVNVVEDLRADAELDAALDSLGQMFRRLRDAHARIPDLVEAKAP